MDTLLNACGAGRLMPRPCAETGRFAPPFRTCIQELVAGSERLADLAQAFPALLFALASGYGSRRERDRCLELVESGQPLKVAAEALGLPLWLRRLPPEAFSRPLKRVPDGPEFGRRIASLVPDNRLEAAEWLARVLTATRCCGEEFALWIARHRRVPPILRDDACQLLLAAWAWHSDRPGTLGHRLLRKPWKSDMGLARALEEARAWQRRVELAMSLKGGIEDCWLEPGEALGYSFVPLRTIEDFLAEAAVMDNCLDQYGRQVAAGTTRVFSIRLRGRTVGDVEIGPHSEDGTMPTVVQLRGPRNRRVVPDVWRAVYSWIGGQRLRPLRQPAASADRLRRQRIRQQMWQPYLAAVEGGTDAVRLRGLLATVERLPRLDRAAAALLASPGAEERASGS